MSDLRSGEDIQGRELPPLALPPLALYVHVPWCLRKCPYCDFNSHAAGRNPDLDAYVERLLADLDQECKTLSQPRPLRSIFIGGGTPSLLGSAQIRRLMDGIRSRMDLARDVEITLEANPGTLDAGHFAAYREAGINRLSIGVQSLSAGHLERLGRIHDPLQARRTLAVARQSGFENINLDMMFALPEQTLDQAAADLEALIALEPEHISYYQLTLEPDTPFHANPPRLPDPDLAADMAAQGVERLAAAGFARYEVSAYARAGRKCRHNINYWRFGDYLGIGAGAHAKMTRPRPNGIGWLIERREKIADPMDYLSAAADSLIAARRDLSEADCVFEFALNAFRLTEGFRPALFREGTGLDWHLMRPGIHEALSRGLLDQAEEAIRPTELGRSFLDDLVSIFASEDA